MMTMSMRTMMMMTLMTAMTKAGSALPTPQLPARTIQNPQRQELFTCKLCFGTKGAAKKHTFSFIHASHKHTDFPKIVPYTCTQVKQDRNRLRGTSGGEENAQKWRRRDRLSFPSGDEMVMSTHCRIKQE